jgi:hypothetical protein
MVVIDTLLPDEENIAQFFQEAEQMRDPTHVRAYTKSEWITMIEDAGFDVQQTKIFPKTHEFQEWAHRTGLNREGVQRLNRFFIEATPEIADYFQIETFAGEVESYTDRKLLIYATRRDVK